MMWPSENIPNITKYRVMISSSQYGHTETNTSVSTAIINLNHSIFYNISIFESTCAAEKYSVFTFGNFFFFIWGITKLYFAFSCLDCELLKDYHVILNRVYMNSSMTALINISSGQTETLECIESKWEENHINKTTSYNHTEQTTSYNGKSLWFTEALLTSYSPFINPLQACARGL